jgi:hypothetical protein
VVIESARYRWKVFGEINKDQKDAANFGDTQEEEAVVVEDRTVIEKGE